MPDIKLNTRIQNKYKTLDEWNAIQKGEFIPLKGEICYAYVDNDIVYQKVGDGTADFIDLPWLILTTKTSTENDTFYIEGTGDTAGSWLGSHPDITEYYPGLKIAYKIGIAGASGGTTLNINNLGEVAVVRNASSTITTHFGVNSIINLTYTIDSSDDGQTPYWKLADYDSDTKTRSSNKTGSKMYIIGATTQSTSGQTTYSNKNCYIGTDNCLYSNSEKVLSSSDGILPVSQGGTGQSDIADSTYTTARYRASSIHSTETTPTQNGVICWTYE